MVTRATMKPPMPPIINGRTAVSGAAVNRFQLQAAVSTAQIRRIPVLFTAPEIVMLSAESSWARRKVFELNAGLDVFIKAIQLVYRYRRMCVGPAAAWEDF